MARYEGLIGKLSQDIFEGSGQGGAGVTKYAGIGALSGGAIGGLQGSFSEEGSFAGGLIRGAAVGAISGAGMNLIPKSINKNLRDSGFNRFDNMEGLADRLISDFKPINDELKSPKMRELLKSFKPIGDNNAKLLTKPKEFAMGVDKDFLRLSADIDPKDFEKLGMNIETAANNFKSSVIGKDFDRFLNNSENKFFQMEQMDQAKVLGSLSGTMAFNSAYKHIVEPAGQFLKKTSKGQSTNMYEKSAAAFSAYGLYEGYHVTQDISEGNWGKAAMGASILVASKALYSQGISGMHAANYLKSKGVSFNEVVNTGKVIGASKIYSKGTSMYGPEDLEELTAFASQQRNLKTAII